VSFRAKLTLRYPPRAPTNRVRYVYNVDGSLESATTPMMLDRVIVVEKPFNRSFKFATDAPRDGLVAEWLLFEGGGNTVYDTSGNSIHCTVGGNYRWVRLPSGKQALELDGSTAGLVCRRSDKSTVLPDGFTFMAWVNPYDLTGRRWLIAKSVTTFHVMLEGGYFGLWVNDDTLPDYFKVSTYPRTVSVNAWHHLVAILDNNNQRWSLVVNGSLWASGSTPKKFNFRFDISPFTVCNMYGYDFFKGLLGMARFYNTLLGLDEVQSIYNVEKQLFEG
jgi:hypothetical protein